MRSVATVHEAILVAFLEVDNGREIPDSSAQRLRCRGDELVLSVHKVVLGFSLLTAVNSEARVLKFKDPGPYITAVPWDVGEGPGLKRVSSPEEARNVTMQF